MAKTRINSRTKGKAHERATVLWYRPFGFSVRRGLQTRTGDEACDVQGDSSFPWAVECKHYKSVGLVRRAWDQAVACAIAAGGKIPIVHLHWDRGDHLVVMSRVYWGRLIEMQQELDRLKAGKDGDNA